MRTSMLGAVALVAPVVALAGAEPAAAQPGVQGSFTVLFPQGHDASNAPCPSNTFCGVGSLVGYGAATITIDHDSFDAIPGSDCLAVTKVEDIALLSGAGVLELSSVGTFCRPGGSGVFAGLTGGGRETMVTAGGVGSWHLSGVLSS